MSNRLEARWRTLKKAGRKALIPYITPEYPIHGCTKDLLLCLAGAGAEFIEIGIPFSDPLADGPVIQSSSQVALTNGVTPMSVLRTVSEVRRTTEVPIILMGYANPLFRLGIDEYLKRASDAGVDGFIVPDLPPEEAGSIMDTIHDLHLGLTFLIAPTSSNQRVKYLDSCSTHFSYCVSVTGVTGNKKGLSDTGILDAFLSRVRENTSKPFVVGFGIATSGDVDRVSAIADGAVVGTGLLRAISACKTSEDVSHTAESFFRSLRPLSHTLNL